MCIYYTLTNNKFYHESRGLKERRNVENIPFFIKRQNKN